MINKMFSKHHTFLMACYLIICFAGFFCWADDSLPPQKPIEQKGISELDVGYVIMSKVAYPAYVDYSAKTLYLWESVTINGRQIPNMGLNQSAMIIDPKKDEWVKHVKYVSPSLSYYLRDNEILIGHYDKTNAVFYQWRGLKFTPDQIPENFKNYKLKENQRVNGITEIPIPPRFWELLFSQLMGLEKERFEAFPKE